MLVHFLSICFIPVWASTLNLVNDEENDTPLTKGVFSFRLPVDIMGIVSEFMSETAGETGILKQVCKEYSNIKVHLHWKKALPEGWVELLLKHNRQIKSLTLSYGAADAFMQALLERNKLFA